MIIPLKCVLFKLHLSKTFGKGSLVLEKVVVLFLNAFHFPLFCKKRQHKKIENLCGIVVTNFSCETGDLWFKSCLCYEIAR